eukprot:2072529-Amphidinium_carterae.2
MPLVKSFSGALAAELSELIWSERQQPTLHFQQNAYRVWVEEDIEPNPRLARRRSCRNKLKSITLPNEVIFAGGDSI